MMNLQNSLKIFVSAIALAATSACVPEAANYTGAEAMKRSEVQMVRLTHEMYLGDGLSSEAATGLNAFLDQHGVGYGDVISLDIGAHEGADWHTAVAEQLRNRGLQLDWRTTVAGAIPAESTAVVVVDRYVVSTPDCGSAVQEPSDDWANRRSPDFGCSSQTLLGLMVANPRDLVQGQDDDNPIAGAATKAIETHRNKAGTGAPPPSGGGISGGASSGGRN